MLGPHIVGGCRVTRSSNVISCRQSACCCSLALDAMWSSTLASVGFVLFSAMEMIGDRVARAGRYTVAAHGDAQYIDCPEGKYGIRGRRAIGSAGTCFNDYGS